MKTIGATEFKQHCLQILDELGPEGIVVTKRGKPVATVMPARRSMSRYIGFMEGTFNYDPEETFQTGAWEPERGIDYRESTPTDGATP